jgi:hypothetical protein
LAGYYNNTKGDKATALSYVDKGLAIDPNNATLQNYKKALSGKPQQQQPSQQKTSTSNNAAKTETKIKTPTTKTKTKQ